VALTPPHWIDLRAGTAGGLVMGGAVGLANATHGLAGALTAGGKQALYTLLIGGLLARMCTRLSERPGPRHRVGAIAVTATGVLTLTLVFLLHSLRGTPDPVISTGVVACIAVPGFVFLSWRATQRESPA
jgi:hypothetical protein